MNRRNLSIFTFLVFFLFSTGCQNSEDLALQGMEALNQGKNVTALRFFEEALRKNKKHPLSLYGKGKILLDSVYTYRQGQQMIEEAITTLKPHWARRAYVDLADSYSRSNQYDRSIEILQEAESKNIKSQQICLLQVHYQIQMRQYNLAESKATACMDAYPDHLEIQISAAMVQAKKMRYPQAIAILNKAYGAAPDNREIVKKLAILHYLNRDITKATTLLQQLKEMQVDPEQKNKIENWIKQAKQKRWEVSL